MSVKQFKQLVLCFLLAALVFVGIGDAQAQAPRVVNVYSARHYGAMETMMAKFTEETGIQVRISQGSVQSLLERIRAEGKTSPADAFFSIDVGSMWLAAQEGLLQPIESQTLADAIPAQFRDTQNRWFGLSQRIRTLMYNPDKVKPEELSTYEALADAKWKGRLCMRPATHIYTISLVASMVARLGEAKTEEVVKGWVANKLQMIDSDTRILETVAAGGCDVAITNHYYLARLRATNPDFKASVFWANQGEGEGGAHVNMSAMGVTANALNKENAVALLEWLATTGQAEDNSGLPGGNYEFPISATAKLNPVLETLGRPEKIAIDSEAYGKNQKLALEILERAGY